VEAYTQTDSEYFDLDQSEPHVITIFGCLLHDWDDQLRLNDDSENLECNNI
jgi:hypothetical protein